MYMIKFPVSCLREALDFTTGFQQIHIENQVLLLVWNPHTNTAATQSSYGALPWQYTPCIAVLNAIMIYIYKYKRGTAYTLKIIVNNNRCIIASGMAS